MFTTPKHVKPATLLLCLLLWSIFLFAQEKKISGKVINAIDGAPITGATITIKSSGAGTVTDAEGAFSITVPNEKSMLIISSVGFDPIEISTAGQTFLTIVLKERQGSLEEVVVTGYTTQKKKDLTGAVSVVNVNQMKAQPVASPVEALQGKATGVHIINDGAPGSTPQIRIRGFSTINNNDPLFIIDGVPFEGKLSWLNQNDIESLQVLKDASAASIYGARANNGVVIITTKKGKNGAPPTVSFDTYVGTQVPRREDFPKMMNPQQFAQYLYTSFNNLNNPAQAPGQGSTTGTNYVQAPARCFLSTY
ncbi:MAG: TonB-dependent receptor plug domain-containing protein [Agriterribacter sp.]